MSFTDYQRKLLITIISSLIYGIILLFVGLIISFFFYYFGTASPVLNKLQGFLPPGEYQAIALQYGFDAPFCVQLYKYIFDFFIGNWGESFVIAPNKASIDLMREILPRTIGILLVPLLIGLIGIKLGKILVKKRNKAQGFIIRIYIVIGLSTPIFFLATLIQFCGIIPGFSLPLLGMADYDYYPIPIITGSPLFDSVISGDWKLAGSLIEYSILPIFILSFMILAIVIKQTQNYIERKTEETAFVSNTLTAGKLFGIIFALVITLEICFNRTGFGYYFISSIFTGDLLLIRGFFYMIVILSTLTIFFANIIPIVYKSFIKIVPNRTKNIKRIVYKNKVLIPKIAIVLTVLGIITPTMGLLEPDTVSFLWYFGFYVEGNDSGFVEAFKYLIIGNIIIILMVIGTLLLLIYIFKLKNKKKFKLAAVLNIVAGLLILTGPVLYYFYVKKNFGYWDTFFPPSYGFILPFIAGILGIISGLLIISENRLKDESLSQFSEQEINLEQKKVTNFRKEFKEYAITSLKNPFVIIGLAILMVLVFLAIFPYLFTPYSINEITIPYIPPGGVPFEPPTPDHPLGTTKYGYDVLARVLYGIQDAFIFGTIITIIGLLFGSIFGYVAGRFHKYVHNGIIGTLTIFLIIPGIMLLAVANALFYELKPRFISILIVGLLLTVAFAGIIANAIRRESSLINPIKIILKSVPLEVAFGIMFYQIVGFFGLIYLPIPQLGTSINYARAGFGEFWALWPGFFLFLLLLSLLLIHEGLKTTTSYEKI